jgi:hypothetical protein
VQTYTIIDVSKYNIVGQDVSCKTLYDYRKEIMVKYIFEVGNEYLERRERAEEIKRELEAIDYVYRTIFKDLMILSENDDIDFDNKTIDNMYTLYKSDPVIEIYFAWFVFHISGDEHDFISKISIMDFNAFWDLPEILSTEDEEFRTILKRNSFEKCFTCKFIDQIYSLAIKGEKKALYCLIKIYDASDGGDAENMVGILDSLFLENAEIVTNNWEVLRLEQYYCGDILLFSKNSALEHKCTNSK